MWFILLVIMAGPMAGTKLVYQPEGQPLPVRFETLEECRDTVREVVIPQARELLPDGARIAVGCVRDDEEENTRV